MYWRARLLVAAGVVILAMTGVVAAQSSSGGGGGGGLLSFVEGLIEFLQNIADLLGMGQPGQ